MNKFRFKLMAAIVVVLSLLSVYSSKASAQDFPWQLKINKEGITVSTRKVEGSAILEFKSSVIVDAPLERVISLYEDPKQLPIWFYQCVEFKQLADEGEKGGVFYFVIRLPWPVAQRDAVFQRVKSVDSKTAQVTYTLSALPERLPQRKGRIRMPYLKTTWSFSSLPNGQTEINFQQHSDAGGSIPVFIVNKLVVDIPFNSLKNLHKLILDQKR